MMNISNRTSGDAMSIVYWLSEPIKIGQPYKGWVYGSEKSLSVRDWLIVRDLLQIDGIAKVGLIDNQIHLCPAEGVSFGANECAILDKRVEKILKYYFPGPIFIEPDVDFTDYNNPELYEVKFDDNGNPEDCLCQPTTSPY